MISTYHEGNIGDIIYALPSLKELSRRHNEKIALYVKCNVMTVYYPGAVHPLGNILINEDYLNQLKPLLEKQEYIGLVSKWNDEPIEFDLNQFRKTIPDLTKNHIPRWYFPILKVSCDLSEPWLKIEKPINYPKIYGWKTPERHVFSIDDGDPKCNRRWKRLELQSSLYSKFFIDDKIVEDHIIVSRTSRYQNHRIDYNILKGKKCKFVGLTQEHEAFCSRFFDIEHQKTENHHDLAKIIANAKLFIGNQSFPFALAEGLKVPRLLEACSFANNVIPHGRDAYEFYNQKDFEVYLGELG